MRAANSSTANGLPRKSSAPASRTSAASDPLLRAVSTRIGTWLQLRHGRQHRQAVHAGQAEIEQDQVGVASLDAGHALLARVGQDGVVAPGLES